MKAQTIKEFLTWQPPHQSYIIDKGILPPQSKLILFGRWQTWKSMLLMHMAFTLATGQDWFGYKTIASPIYLLQTEIAKAEFLKRIKKYIGGNKSTPDNIYLRTEGYIKLDRSYGAMDLEKEIQETQPQILMLDPVYAIMSGKIVDEHDVRFLTDWLNKIIDKYKLSVVLIHHDRKPLVIGGEIYSSADDIFGSSIFLDWTDTAIRTTNTGKDAEVMLSFEKVRHAEEELKPIRVRINRSDLTFMVMP